MEGGQSEKTEFYRSVLISLDALRVLADRYVDMLLSASQNAPDEQRRHELRMMARVCARVPEEPPGDTSRGTAGGVVRLCAVP